MSEKKQSIGGLWKKKVNGKEMYSGTVEINGVKTRLDVWPNTFKKEEKQPDFKIFINDYVPKAKVENENSDLPF